MRRCHRHRLPSPRAAACVGSLAALLALGCALPGGAWALGSSLQQQVETPETTKSTETSTSSGTTKEAGNSHTTILLAMGAAVVLLSGIAFVIVRDARRVAPATDTEVLEGRGTRDTALMLRKRRAKAKAARRQRKRNR